VNSMNAIIERCLQSDRLAHGRVGVTVHACDVPALVDDIRATCSEPHRVVVSHGDISPARTDRQLFSVIVANLIDNALKYGAPGAEVQVAIDPNAQGGAPGLRIEVSNAVGAAGKPDPKRVFKKYYRAPSAQGKVGSGLGLHIADGFARKIGGRLRYIPMADKVNFELWIPV
jgi:K+-sensing histidine kinase KdpD